MIPLRHLSTCSALIAIAIACSGCHRTPTAPAQPAVAPPHVPPPARDAAVQTRYACDDGNYVDVMTSGMARIAMSDGRSVSLGKIENSVPPTWQDVGLTFITSSTGAELDQDDGARSLSCKAQG